MTKLLPSAFVTAVFCAAFVLFTSAGVNLFHDIDVPWHLAAGDLIRSSLHIPTVDSWSYTAGNHPWYEMFWLSEAVLSLLEQLGGLKLVFLFSQAFNALIIALVAWHLTRREGLKGDAIVCTLFVLALGWLEFDTARPYITGNLMVVLFMDLLYRGRGDDNIGKLWWLPPLMALWVNLHGSFFVGFTLLGAYGLEALWYRRWQRFIQLIVVSACCVLALLINPFGIGIANAVMSSLGNLTTKTILEWLPFVFGNSLGISAWVLLFVLASGFRDGRISLADKILSLCWFVATLTSIRDACIFMLVSAPFVALSLQHVLEQLDSIRTVRTDPVEALSHPRMKQLFACAAIVVLAGGWLALGTLRPDYAYDRDNNPTAAISWLQAHLGNRKLLNDGNYGGFIIYQTRGTLPVYVDSRVGTAYPDPVLSDYMAYLNQDKGWEKMIDTYGIGAIFASNGQLFAKAYEAGQYHDQWQRAYHDDLISVYFKK